ncbi:MAG: exo-alpha-sialidase, partial [Clostridia bacterium]|nr:exo-alpha-sialidase [Clostridia bacterium]
FDKMALEFRVNAEGGDAAILRYQKAKSGHAAEKPANMTTENDNFYYLHEKTGGGWKVTVFISYDFMGVPKEYAYGNVRVVPGMRNSDSDSVTTRTAYIENGTVGTRVDTWLVIDTDNTFIRDDFDTVSFAEDIPAGNAYKSCAFINQLASISSTTANSALRLAQPGASVFQDRVYGFEQTALPTELVGKSYICAPIDGAKVTVEKSGYVVLLVSGLSNYNATNQKLLSAGWERLLFAAKTPCNIAVTEDIHDSANWYVKHCNAGETIDYGKWVVAFGAAGETEPFAWESCPGIISTDTSDPTYSFSDRVWQGIPTGEATNGGRLIAGWNSGDVGEGKAGNYAILGCSDDDGKTWKECLYVEGPESASGTKLATVCDVQIWLDKDTNTLYVFYLMSSTMNRFEKSSAVWMFTITNPDDPIKQWKISESTYAFPGLLRNNITVLSDGTWIAAPNSYMDDRYTVVYASNDKGKTWDLRSSAYMPRARNYDETVITELSDGTLWMTVRANTSSDTGRKIVYQSFSFDKGETWTVCSETDIFHCTTRFNFTRLPSGALLMVYNAKSGRN